MASSPKHSETAQRMLKEAGIRVTMPRIAVLSALLAAHKPVSADHLAQELADLQADKVTIYRILRMFSEKGLAHQVDVGDQIWRFASCGDDHHHARHAHFYCRNCGGLECLDADKAGVIEERPAPAGHLVEVQEILLRGLCPGCRKTR
jgi:Fur family ferric uptake transcriptional regulator